MKHLFNVDIALLLLRVVTGFLFLPHGLAKVSSNFAGVKAMLAKAGLPEMLYLGTFVGEIIAPICLMLGLFSRIAGLLIAFVMVFAIALTEGAAAFTKGATGGYLGELNFLYLIIGITFFIAGAGKYAFKLKSKYFLWQ
jgi:putative oxidoreductase